MEDKSTISKVIPEGEFNCIWAEAGLVSFKLCDRNFECDACPFDQAMRQKSAPAPDAASGDRSKSAASKVPETQSKQDALIGMVSNTFSGPLSRKPPADRGYSRGHVWTKEMAEGVFRIGIDHYAAGLLEGIGSVVFPQAGSSSVRESPCAWVVCEDGTISVQSPINGKIRSVNAHLMESPALVRSDPYESGWLTEIRSEEGPVNILDCSEIESLSSKHLKSIEEEVLGEFNNKLPALGVTLLDGGLRPTGLRDVLGPTQYISVLQRLFSSRT